MKLYKNILIWEKRMAACADGVCACVYGYICATRRDAMSISTHITPYACLPVHVCTPHFLPSFVGDWGADARQSHTAF